MNKKRNKSIVIFCGYFSPHIGGVEKYVAKLGAELAKNNYQIIVVTTRHEESLKRKETINGVLVYRLPIYKLFKNRYPLPKNDKNYRAILKNIETHSPDAIILNTRFHLTSLVGARFAKKQKIKTILIEHGSSHYSIGSKYLDFLGRIYEHLLTFVIKRYVKNFYGVSKECNKWLKHYKIKARGVVYNSIDVDDSKGVKPIYRQGVSNGTVIITFAGRLLFEKGLREFMTAIDRLKSPIEYKVMIAGDGPLIAEVQKFIESNKNVKYLGRLSSEQMKSLYKSTDIFVHPSWTEGMPTAILEAAFFENSIVATAVGGTSEIIRDGYTGTIVPRKNPEKLRVAIERQMMNKSIRSELGKRAHSAVVDNFSWPKTVEEVIKALNI